jgi:predicted nucleotidyltransferase
MVDLIEKHILEISNLCDKYNVARLEVFGSATDSARFNNDESDLDFLVKFHELPDGTHADHYFELFFALKDIFNRDIDLVMSDAIKNKYFLEAIKSHREVVYAA